VDSETWWDYVQRHLDARGWSQTDLARHGGIDLSIIHRWRTSGSLPSPKNARLVAVALGRPVVEVAEAAGHYSREDLAMPEPDIKAFSNEDLIEEVRARMVGDSRLQSDRRASRSGRRNGIEVVPGGAGQEA
jgi:transcriptional regulator with XRE-family HTH domain